MDKEFSKWEDVEEVCFTVFDEPEYFLNRHGSFEVVDLTLDR